MANGDDLSGRFGREVEEDDSDVECSETESEQLGCLVNQDNEELLWNIANEVEEEGFHIRQNPENIGHDATRQLETLETLQQRLSEIPWGIIPNDEGVGVELHILQNYADLVHDMIREKENLATLQRRAGVVPNDEGGSINLQNLEYSIRQLIRIKENLATIRQRRAGISGELANGERGEGPSFSHYTWEQVDNKDIVEILAHERSDNISENMGVPNEEKGVPNITKTLDVDVVNEVEGPSFSHYTWEQVHADIVEILDVSSDDRREVEKGPSFSHYTWEQVESDIVEILTDVTNDERETMGVANEEKGAEIINVDALNDERGDDNVQTPSNVDESGEMEKEVADEKSCCGCLSPLLRGLRNIARRISRFFRRRKSA